MPVSLRRLTILCAAVAALVAGLLSVLAPAASAQAATPAVAVLRAPGTLTGGHRMVSANGNFTLLMGRNGNVLLENRWGQPMWSTRTAGHHGARLNLQADGNLVLRAPSGRALWASKTRGSHAVLELRASGVLELVARRHALWYTHTAVKYGAHDNPYPAASLAPGSSLTAGHRLSSANGRYHATMAASGGFVVAGPGSKVLWQTNSAGWLGARLSLTRGNLALRAANGVALWSSGTSTGSLLVLGNDGNLVLDNARGTAVWQSARAAQPSFAPPQSTSHYVRDITGAATDAATMSALGRQDAAAAGAGKHLVVLDIGAQFSDRGDGTQWGVELTGTDTTLTDEQLVTALEGYLDGYGTELATGSQLLLAVATNNDSSQYQGDGCAGPPAGTADPLGTAGGTEWASVVGQLATYAGSTSAITLAGADDIEAGNVGCAGQASDWTTAFAANSSQPYVFIGSADGCPTTLGSAKGCSYDWTQEQLYGLAYGLDSAHSIPLPQIYNAGQAVQWANISRAGGSPIAFGGVLTQQGVCGSSCSLAGTGAWNELANQLTLSTGKRTGAGPYSTDLQVN